MSEQEQREDGGIQLPREHRPFRPASDDLDDDDDIERTLPIRQADENRTMAIWSHWGGLMGWIIVPLVFYAIEKDKRSLVAWHAREELNFQISILIYYLLTIP